VKVEEGEMRERKEERGKRRDEGKRERVWGESPSFRSFRFFELPHRLWCFGALY
jgi:hypothetical protein